MPPGRPWAIATSAAHYLLGVTVALLVLDVVVAVESWLSLRRMTLVVAGAFALLALARAVTGAPARNDAETDRGSRRLTRARRKTGTVRPTASDRTTVRSRTFEPRSVVLALAGLALVGGVLRAYALGAQSLWFDEAITTNASIALLEAGRPTFPSGVTYWRAFPHTLVVAGSMALFGTGEAVARLPSVVFGVATIVATYWLGRAVGGPRVGVLAAVLVTFATWEIAWSRQARMYQLFQLCFVASLVALLRVERTWFGDWRAVLALAAGIVLAAATHQIGYVLLPVAVASLALSVALDGRLDRFVDGALDGRSPRAHTAAVVGRPTRAALVTVLAGSVAFVAVIVALAAVGTGLAAVRTLATTNVDYWPTYEAWLTAELHGFFWLGIVGAALTFYRGWYHAGTLLVLAVVPATWLLSFHTPLLATRYLYFGLPVLFVWAAVTIEYVAGVAIDRGRSIRHRRAGTGPSAVRGEAIDATGSSDGAASASTTAVTVAAFGLVAVLALGGGFTVTPQATYELGINAPQPDFGGAYAHVNEHREPGDVVVAGWTAPGLYYAGGVDYWLTHDLTGTDGADAAAGTDRYAGAEPIRSAAELEDVIATHDRGWVVVDAIAMQRQDAETLAVLSRGATLEVDRGGVVVLSWGREERS